MVGRRQKLRIFVDSSVLFAAVCSPVGGSAKLFTLGDVILTASLVVLAEVERNVRAKLEDYHLDRFFLLASKLNVIEQSPDNDLVVRAKKVIVEKDAVILAEAKNSGVEILVTLDRKHFLAPLVRKFFRPGKIMTPKEVLEEWFSR